MTQTIYTVGGTVQAGGGIYIPRKADDELLGYCRASEFVFILSSRQVGKSSLMVRTAQRLESENIRSVIVDLSGIGVKISADEWYLGILNEIANTLELKTDIFAWWSERAALGPAQRLINFFRDVLFKEVSEPVVIFFDEIDSTLSIPFADDFFAALRAIHNVRSTVPDFKQLSFVMIGVATPGQLITDSKRTPFNIGYRVDLTDFTFEETLPLAGGLDKQVLSLVLSWTGGHPYLTQRLCAYLSKSESDITAESVEDTVRQLFEGEQGQQDNNLQFVRDMLTKRSPDIQRVLKTYKDIRSGKKVSDDERSIPKAHLKISGVVCRENGRLQLRNRIYERAFDLTWVKENTPSTTMRRLVISLSFVTIIALMIAGLFAWQEWNRTDAERANRFVLNFQSTNDSDLRLKNLAGLFELSDATNDFDDQASGLFTNLDQADKIELFAPSNMWGVDEYQLTVALGVYQNMAITHDNNAVLSAIGERMETIHPDLSIEINAWIEGRDALMKTDYLYAEKRLTSALKKNPKNPSLYYDRAQAYAGMGQDYYPKTFNDLMMMVQLDKRRAIDSYIFINTNPSLAYYWDQNVDNYPELAQAMGKHPIQIRAYVWKAVTLATDSQLIFIVAQNASLQPLVGVSCTAVVHWPDDRIESTTTSTNANGVGIVSLSFNNQPYGSLIYADISCSYEGYNEVTTTSFRIWY